MRKYVVLSLTFLLVLFAAVSSDAKSAKNSSTKKYVRMHGDIESVDSTAKTFTVKHGDETSTFKTDDATKFRGAGKVIGFTDLMPGDDVRVSYTEDGTDKTAARVDVVHGKKPMMDKKPS
jgi:hypothetical protein